MPQSDGQPQPQPFAARHEQPGRVGRKTAMPMMTSHNTATGRLSPQYGVAGNGASLAAAATTPAWACALKRALLRTRPYIRWWSCLFILCVIVTGIGVSNAVYREISGRERRELQRDLEVVARMDVQSGNEVFERITRSVLNLRIAFRIAPVGTLTFREFVDSVKILDRPQAATSFLWAPHVTAEERDAFESRTRAINSNETRFVNFTITDASRSSSQPSAMSFAVAPNRTEYFPLLYDWSSINMPVVDQPGVDFLNLPGISNISDAVASGLPLIRIFMAPPEHDRMGKELLIIIPVYETADFPPTVEARQQSILGLLSVGAGVGTLIDNVRRAPADLEMYIFDESNVLLYANANPSIPTAQSPADIGSVHGSRFDIVAQIADRTITIVCVPTQKLVDKNTSVNPVLFACLTGLGFMVILVASVCAIRTIVKGQEKVAMAERRRQCVNEMIGFVNHELRNPLNAIVGLIDHATMMMEDIVSAFARLSSVPDVDKSLATTNASMRTTCSAISHVRSGAASLEGGDGNGSKACLSRTSSMGSAASDLADKVGSVLRDLRDTGQMCSLMRHIVDDVLDIRRLEEGALKVLISPVSLDMLLDEVKAIVQPKLSEKPTLSLSVEGLGRDVFFRCDPVRVKQVLLNFVVNAIKYSDAGPLSVRVAATEDGERLRFSVQDHGRGIEDSKKPYLFQPFMQLNGAARHQGVGLGLYLCSMLVDAMCGEIGFDSTAGVGSTFWFEIPPRQRSPVGNESSPPSPAPRRPTASHRAAALISTRSAYRARAEVSLCCHPRLSSATARYVV
eukprot:Opistho-2@53834